MPADLRYYSLFDGSCDWICWFDGHAAGHVLYADRMQVFGSGLGIPRIRGRVKAGFFNEYLRIKGADVVVPVALRVRRRHA